MDLWNQAILNDVEEKSRRLPFRLYLPLGLERGRGQLQDTNFVCAIPWAVSGAHLPSRLARASGRHFALNIETEDRLFPELVDPQRRSGGAPTSHMGCAWERPTRPLAMRPNAQQGQGQTCSACVCSCWICAPTAQGGRRTPCAGVSLVAGLNCKYPTCASRHNHTRRTVWLRHNPLLRRKLFRVFG